LERRIERLVRAFRTGLRQPTLPQAEGDGSKSLETATGWW